MGGIAIFVGMISALVIGLPFQEWIRLKFFFVSITLMFIIGLRDDVLGLSPSKKLISQLLPISILVIFGQMALEAYFFQFDLSELPAWMNGIIVALAFILITNSYNLIDGLDGLAGTIAVICLIVFGVWFYAVGAFYLSLISFASVGAIASFLSFNWEPSKIFMGDTGALLIGLLLSFFSINFVNQNSVLSSDHFVKFESSIGTLICILIIPVFDTSRVVIYRIRKGLSPLRADKNHIHHQFLRLGLSHSKSVIWIAAINLLFIALAILLRKQSDIVLIPLVVVLCLFINFALKWAQKNAGNHSQSL